MRQALEGRLETAPLEAVRPAPRLQPFTERILARLPGSRIVEIAAWALIPWLNAGANLLLDTKTSAVWEQRRLLVLLNYVALSVAIVLTLGGRSA
jgi:hypothetical protein